MSAPSSTVSFAEGPAPGRRVQTSPMRAVDNPSAIVAAPRDDTRDQSEELAVIQAELEGLRLSVLEQRARTEMEAMEVNFDEVEQCLMQALDAVKPRESLVSLVLTRKFGERVVEEATLRDVLQAKENQAMRRKQEQAKKRDEKKKARDDKRHMGEISRRKVELKNLTLSALKAHALRPRRHGDPLSAARATAVINALDSAEPRKSLIQVILKHEFPHQGHLVARKGSSQRLGPRVVACVLAWAPGLLCQCVWGLGQSFVRPRKNHSRGFITTTITRYKAYLVPYPDRLYNPDPLKSGLLNVGVRYCQNIVYRGPWKIE